MTKKQVRIIMLLKSSIFIKFIFFFIIISVATNSCINNKSTSLSCLDFEKQIVSQQWFVDRYIDSYGFEIKSSNLNQFKLEFSNQGILIFRYLDSVQTTANSAWKFDINKYVIDMKIHIKGYEAMLFKGLEIVKSNGQASFGYSVESQEYKIVKLKKHECVLRSSKGAVLYLRN